MPITVHEGDTIVASTFVIEEHVFINCKLKNCRLYYSGGTFEWANTTFENCQWGFRDAAGNTLRLQMMIGMIKQGQAPLQNIVAGTAGSKIN
jgi:hypothetical protein